MKNNNKVEIVITMGGLGTRFTEKGYILPKYMIEVKGKTLFDWSMISLESIKNYARQYIFIALDDKTINIKNFIKQHCEILNITKYKIIIIDKLTAGQAQTVLHAKKYCKKKNPLLIYNIDTFVEPGEIKITDFKGDGFIPCFKASGHHWSFVRLDDNGEVIEIKEKERISDYCTIGAYYFKTFELYEELYNEFYGNPQNIKEQYVAPLYDYLLKKGGKIYISDINPEKVHVLGTPEELDIFREK